MTEAYPLTWPRGFARTKSPMKSRFTSTLNAALNNVKDELRRFGNDTGKGVTALVLSSNVTLGVQRPSDAGVAAYFQWEGIDCCIAIDRYGKPEENLQAIAKVIEAERAKMRHGGLNIVRASFRGFAALPPPTGPAGQIEAPWRVVLFGKNEATVTRAQVDRRYRELVKDKHPDRGGDPAEFNRIVDAVSHAREELA